MKDFWKRVAEINAHLGKVTALLSAGQPVDPVDLVVAMKMTDEAGRLLSAFGPNGKLQNFHTPQQ